MINRIITSGFLYQAAVGPATAMSETNTGGSDGETSTQAFTTAIESYLRDKGKGAGGESGHYRRNAERVLTDFVSWCGTSGAARTWDDVDADVLRTYTRSELLDTELSPRTTHKYFDYLSAWLGWCQREGLVDEHYGKHESAREPLPDLDTRKTARQQTWRPEQRQAILAFVDEHAREAIETEETGAVQPVRDRALVYLFAYVGTRGAEVFADSQDSRRNGATWGDLSADYATLTVLSKNQEWSERAVPNQARPALERWESLLDPVADWPLFPTLHYPTLYAALREADSETEGFDGHADVFDTFRGEGVTPPAISTDGARRTMERLTAAADIDVEENYLQLHGARRGVGRTLTIEQGVHAAADQLDNSTEIIEDAYSDVLTKERAERTSEAFSGETE